MDTEVMFSHKSDEWATPIDLFKKLHKEFDFKVDAAAQAHNRLCDYYYGPDHKIENLRDALHVEWSHSEETHWCNPPYSMCKQFVAKAAIERTRGVQTVMLLPSRTDTKWFQHHLYDESLHLFREGIEVRFIKGRLKFGGATNSAPFPSLIAVFHP